MTAASLSLQSTGTSVSSLVLPLRRALSPAVYRRASIEVCFAWLFCAAVLTWWGLHVWDGSWSKCAYKFQTYQDGPCHNEYYILVAFPIYYAVYATYRRFWVLARIARRTGFDRPSLLLDERSFWFAQLASPLWFSDVLEVSISQDMGYRSELRLVLNHPVILLYGWCRTTGEIGARHPTLFFNGDGYADREQLLETILAAAIAAGVSLAPAA